MSHLTPMSLEWREMDLTGGPLSGQGTGWMVALKEMWSMAQCPSGER